MTRLKCSWLPAIWVVGIILVVFSPTLAAQLTNWDDVTNTTANPLFNPPTWRHLAYLWLRPYDKLYIPLTMTIYFIEVVLGGFSPALFHATNLGIHVLAALVVLRIVFLVLKHSAPQAP